jgi:hypothetical protein
MLVKLQQAAKYSNMSVSSMTLSETSSSCKLPRPASAWSQHRNALAMATASPTTMPHSDAKFAGKRHLKRSAGLQGGCIPQQEANWLK